MHAVDPAPALLLHGQASLPHFWLRVLSPSRGHVPQPRTVVWMRSRSDGIAARILGGDPSVVDHVVWHPGAMPPIYARPDPEGGCWVRERDGSAERIIVLNSRQVDFRDGELAVRFRFSERAELVARRQDSTWRLSVDPASPAGVCLEHFEVQDRASAPQRFVLADGTSELAPGEERLLVAVP
jgi:hypothetical protein